MPTPLCPRDATPLVLQADALGPDTRAHACPRCAGVLVDWKQAQPLLRSLGVSLQDLKALVQQAERAPAAQPPPPCPACGQGALAPFRLKGTPLDLCEACGALWLDRGELARLTQGRLGADAPAAPRPVAGLREETVGVYEMLWDCAYCGTRALLGKSHRYCPSCGAAQDASRRYFPPEGQEVRANTEYDGADRQCPACQTPNGAKATHCRQCGSPLEGAAEVARVADQVTGAPPPRRAAAPAPKGRRLWPWLLGGAAVLLIGVCGVGALWTKPTTVTVTGHAWSREVDVEVLGPRGESAWCDSLPSDAYGVSRSREQRSTRKVADGEDCTTRNVDRGDGTFERRRECRTRYREEPVYDDRCSYTVDRWQTRRTARATGGSLSPPPAWPEVRLAREGRCRGCEREGARRETYTLQLEDAQGKPQRCSFPEAKWRGFAVGERRPAKARVLTGGLDCGSL